MSNNSLTIEKVDNGYIVKTFTRLHKEPVTKIFPSLVELLQFVEKQFKDPLTKNIWDVPTTYRYTHITVEDDSKSNHIFEEAENCPCNPIVQFTGEFSGNIIHNKMKKGNT